MCHSSCLLVDQLSNGLISVLCPRRMRRHLILYFPYIYLAACYMYAFDFSVDYRLLIAHISASEQPNQARHTGLLHENSALADFVAAFPDGNTVPLVPSVPQDSSVVGVRTGHNIRSDVIPLMLSPSYLAAMLLTGGFFAQAAHIHWMVVIKRPAGMYTPNAAVSLLLHHLSHSTLPFYLSHPAAPKEVTDSVWGWGMWPQLCRLALSRE